MKKFLSFIIITVLVVGLGVGALLLFGPKQEASAVMTLDLNPNIQLVLDQNDKVMYVNALNEDGESLALHVNLVGADAEDAAKLFVEAATNAGIIELSTSGRTINITIDCEDASNEKMLELQADVKEKVNNYFKEVGVKAGAIVEVGEDYLNRLQDLGADVSDMAGKTYQEVMKSLEENSSNLEDVALSLQSQLMTTIQNLQAQIDAAAASLEATIDELQTQIDNINPKTEIGKTMIKSLEKQIDNAKKEFKEFKSQIEESIKNAVENMKQQSKTILQSAKTAFNNLVEQHEVAVEQFKANYEANKTTRLAEIEAWQNSLNAN